MINESKTSSWRNDVLYYVFPGKYIALDNDWFILVPKEQHLALA
jgi:hypothetical protein